MKKHFVTFFSPGTFCAETTQKPIDSWDVEKAKEMASEIVERHGATPYGFQFTTRSQGEADLDSHETERSGVYFLGGQVLTIDDVRARKDPKEEILLSNMEINRIEKIVVNTNSWKWTQPLRDGDVVLDWTPPTREKLREG